MWSLRDVGALNKISIFCSLLTFQLHTLQCIIIASIISPTQVIAAADMTPIKKRSTIMNSTLCVLSDNIIHMMEEIKLHATIMIFFPSCCDIQPPAKKPIMHPRDKAAPTNESFFYKGMQGIDIRSDKMSSYLSMKHLHQWPPFSGNHASSYKLAEMWIQTLHPLRQLLSWHIQHTRSFMSKNSNH